MWFAVTAHQKARTKKESRKEFSAGRFEVIMNADTREGLESKLNESISKYPKEMEKYLKAGIMIVEAENPAQARRRAPDVKIYFDQRGQYGFI